MTKAVLFSLAGLISGLLGSVLLAISLSRWVDTISWAIDALNTSVMTVASPGDAVVFTGIETHVERDQKRATFLVTFGLWLLVLSFFLQGVGIWLGASVH
jgi:hypothetical protein